MSDDLSLENLFNNSLSVANGTSRDLRIAVRQQVAPTTIVTGTVSVTTAGTRVQITATSTPIAWVDVAGVSDNSNQVVIGDSSVVAALATQQGTPLFGGNQPIRIYIDDLSKLWVDSISNGDSLTYTYYAY